MVSPPQIPDFLSKYSGKTPYLPDRLWVIEALVTLEQMSGVPVISRLAVATSIRRATIYAALAALKLEPTAQVAVAELGPVELVDWLLTAEPGHVIDVVLGEVKGLTGVVAKAFDPLQDPQDYLWIAKTMRAETRRTARQTNCLRHARHVTSDFVASLKLLRTSFLRPALVSALGSRDSAEHLEALISHLSKVAPSLPEPVMAQSLELGGVADLFCWASRNVLRHGVGLASGLADCANFRFLNTGADYQKTAQSFQNCLADEARGHALTASFGVMAVAEWRHDKVLAVLSLMSDGGDTPVWVCEHLWGPANSQVPDAVAKSVTVALRQRGILTLAQTAPPGTPRVLLDRYCDRPDYLTLLLRDLED